MYKPHLFSQSQKKEGDALLFFEERLQQLCLHALEQFNKATRSTALFHLFFFALAFLEIFLFLLFFSFLAASSLLAFSIAALFLTGFSYFVLLFYFQAKKPEQLQQIKEEYLEGCKNALPLEKHSNEWHRTLSQALSTLAESLKGKEIQSYSIPIQSLRPVIEKFSIWAHWKDVYEMREKLYRQAIHQQIQVVKAAPSDLQAHASLGAAYVSLSRLYKAPKDAPWTSSSYDSEEIKKRLEATLERALEEYKIIGHYSPQDPWVHAQLASLYHELHRTEEEIKEYETMLKISPQDRQVLFRLGILYFKQGAHAKGLRTYEQLKKIEQEMAEALVSYYDAFLNLELNEKAPV